MSSSLVYYLLLFISVVSVLGLVMFKPKRLEHLLFALLALSLALLSVSQLLPASFIIEQQFIALGTFATCNVFWLLSRCLFRKGNALTSQHYVLAGSIAALILLSRSVDIMVSLNWLQQDTVIWLKRSLAEILKLLSSAVLLLAFWEAIRHYNSSNKARRKQKILFAGSMLLAVLSTRVIVPSIPVSPEMSAQLYLWVRGVAASLILVTTFLVLWLQYQQRVLAAAHVQTSALGPDEDEELITTMQNLMIAQKPYLTAELKMVDVANALKVSEYRITRALREKSNFDNFNHFINSYRIEHAKQLLVAGHSQHWTILVISMESGFASLAPFNRAFKAQVGCTPNQYRKSQLEK